MALQRFSTTFLDLPPEIRNEIYMLHLDNILDFSTLYKQESIYRYTKRPGLPNYFWKHLFSACKSLPQTCRQVRSDVRPILDGILEKLDLVVSITAKTLPVFERFLSTAAERTVQSMTSITLMFPADPKAVSYNPQALVLTITFDQPNFTFVLDDSLHFRRWVYNDLSIVDCDEFPGLTGPDGEPASPSRGDLRERTGRIGTALDRLHDELCAGPWPKSPEQIAARKRRYEWMVRTKRDISIYGLDSANFHPIRPIEDWAPQGKVLPLFIQPVIDAWRGTKFTKAGLLKLVQVLGVALEEEPKEGSEQDREQTKSGDERMATTDAEDDIGLDANSQAEATKNVHSLATNPSLIVRLPIKRAGFQVFPWGVEVGKETRTWARSY